MNWKPVILVTSLAGVGVGIYFLTKYISRQKTLLEDYGIEPLSVKFTKQSADLVTIDFGVRLQNKSDIEATVKKIYADVYLNDQIIGSITNNEQFVVPAKGYSDAILSITVAPKQILKNIVSAAVSLLQKKDVYYRLNGYVKIASGFAGLSLPFDYNGSAKEILTM